MVSTMTLKPCLDCGRPSPGSRCPEHTTERRAQRPREARGYDWTWRALSLRARRMQPFCSNCQTTEDLTVDHTEEAWQRKTAGKVIRLRDVQVLCRPCNARKGAAR